MGRKKSLVEKPVRTAMVQFRCTPAYKERLEGLARRTGHPDLTAFLEATIERERRRAGDEPFPPR